MPVIGLSSMLTSSLAMPQHQKQKTPNYHRMLTKMGDKAKAFLSKLKPGTDPPGQTPVDNTPSPDGVTPSRITKISRKLWRQSKECVRKAKENQRFTLRWPRSTPPISPTVAPIPSTTLGNKHSAMRSTLKDIARRRPKFWQHTSPTKTLPTYIIITDGDDESSCQTDALTPQTVCSSNSWATTNEPITPTVQTTPFIGPLDLWDTGAQQMVPHTTSSASQQAPPRESTVVDGPPTAQRMPSAATPARSVTSRPSTTSIPRSTPASLSNVAVIDKGKSMDRSDWATSEAGQTIAQASDVIEQAPPSSGHQLATRGSQIHTPSARSQSTATPPRSWSIHVRKRGATRPLDPRVLSLMSSSPPTAANGPSPASHPRQWGDLSGNISSLGSDFVTRGLVQAHAAQNRPSYAAPAPEAAAPNWADLSSEVSTLSHGFATRGLEHLQNQGIASPAQVEISKMSTDSSLEASANAYADSFHQHRVGSQDTDDLNNAYGVRDAEEANADDVFFQPAAQQPPSPPHPTALSTPSLSPPGHYPPVPAHITGTKDPSNATFPNGLADIHLQRPPWHNHRLLGFTLPPELHHYGANMAPNWHRDDEDWGNPGWPRSEHTTPRSNHLIYQAPYPPRPPSPQMPRDVIGNLFHRVQAFGGWFGHLVACNANNAQRREVVQGRMAELNKELGGLDREIADAEGVQADLKLTCAETGIDAEAIVQEAERRVLEERAQEEQQQARRAQEIQDTEMYDAPAYVEGDTIGPNSLARTTTRASEASTIILPVRRAANLPANGLSVMGLFARFRTGSV